MKFAALSTSPLILSRAAGASRRIGPPASSDKFTRSKAGTTKMAILSEPIVLYAAIREARGSERAPDRPITPTQ